MNERVVSGEDKEVAAARARSGACLGGMAGFARRKKEGQKADMYWKTSWTKHTSDLEGISPVKWEIGTASAFLPDP